MWTAGPLQSPLPTCLAGSRDCSGPIVIPGTTQGFTRTNGKQVETLSNGLRRKSYSESITKQTQN